MVSSLVSFESWSVLTADFLFLLYVMLGGVTLSAILHLCSAKWRYEVRDVGVSLFGLFPLVFALLVILLIGGKLTFPWLTQTHTEHPMPGWHNYIFFVVREIGAMLFIYWLFSRFIKLQVVSEESEENWGKYKQIAYWIPVAYVLYGTMIAWDFEMTIIPSWHSAIYGMYHFVSNFGMFMSFNVTLFYFLSKSGKLVKPLPDYVYNYIAQMMLAFTILWTYTFFAQYLTIWYGNLPHERNRIMGMQEGDYSCLFWGFFTLKFLIPFVCLVFPYTRHTPAFIVTLACSIMIGTWIEHFTWIAGAYPTDKFTPSHYPFTGIFDVVVTVVVVAVAVWLVKRTLAHNKLLKV